MSGKATKSETPGTWIFKAIPRDVMQRVKIAAAVEGRTVKDLILSLVETHLKEMDRKGQLPKGRG
ncbi:MAG: hypothetical protein ABL983_14655 [Nitrospira sp.]